MQTCTSEFISTGRFLMFINSSRKCMGYSKQHYDREMILSLVGNVSCKYKEKNCLRKIMHK